MNFEISHATRDSGSDVPGYLPRPPQFPQTKPWICQALKLRYQSFGINGDFDGSTAIDCNSCLYVNAFLPSCFRLFRDYLYYGQILFYAAEGPVCAGAEWRQAG